MIRVILQKFGYFVCPYGYENTLLDLKSKLMGETRNSKTGRRIRFSPDLLVYDDQDVMPVEVKMRGKSPPMIRASEIKNFKEFWNDSTKKAERKKSLTHSLRLEKERQLGVPSQVNFASSSGFAHMAHANFVFAATEGGYSPKTEYYKIRNTRFILPGQFALIC